jgi:hypothetical protein
MKARDTTLWGSPRSHLGTLHLPPHGCARRHRQQPRLSFELNKTSLRLAWVVGGSRDAGAWAAHSVSTGRLVGGQQSAHRHHGKIIA